VISASYDSANKSLYFATEDHNLFLYNLTNKSLSNPINLKGKPTCIRTFEAFKDFIFLGLEEIILPAAGSFGGQ